jgi:hypothetical protein
VPEARVSAASKVDAGPTHLQPQSSSSQQSVSAMNQLSSTTRMLNPQSSADNAMRDPGAEKLDRAWALQVAYIKPDHPKAPSASAAQVTTLPLADSEGPHHPKSVRP